jgi:hypothetical protein
MCIKINQLLMQRPSTALVSGVRMHKRLQSAETAYADAYCKMNQGMGPYTSVEKHLALQK